MSTKKESTASVGDVSTCFACGPENPRGLRLQFTFSDDGSMSAPWVAEADLEGYAGIVHGGLISTVLDEAMAKVVAATVGKALTAELRVRFRKQAPSGKQLMVRGWIESRDKRMIRAEAELLDAEEAELAHGWATFMPVK